METQAPDQFPRRTLAKRFYLSLIVMYVVLVLASAPTVYFITENQVYNQAKKDLVLLVDVVKSIQDFVAKDLRPHFLQEKIFYSPSFSGIVATSRISKYLSEKQPLYYINNSSDNPLNPQNKAQGLERKLLEEFRQNRGLKSLNRVGIINGQNYLVSSAPKVSKKGCLLCHGKPEAAPQDVKVSYGTASGYGYRTGEVVGVSVVGVPLEDVQALSIQRSLIVIGGITVLFTVLFIVVNLLVRRLIIEPIIEITSVAKAVSHGEIGREVVIQKRNDEISDLALSFELMRRSLVIAMKRIKRKP